MEASGSDVQCSWAQPGLQRQELVHSISVDAEPLQTSCFCFCCWILSESFPGMTSLSQRKRYEWNFTFLLWFHPSPWGKHGIWCLLPSMGGALSKPSIDYTLLVIKELSGRPSLVPKMKAHVYGRYDQFHKKHWHWGDSLVAPKKRSSAGGSMALGSSGQQPQLSALPASALWSWRVGGNVSCGILVRILYMPKHVTGCSALCNWSACSVLDSSPLHFPTKNRTVTPAVFLCQFWKCICFLKSLFISLRLSLLHKERHSNCQRFQGFCAHSGDDFISSKQPCEFLLNGQG